MPIVLQRITHFCKQTEKFPPNVENKKESDAEKTLPQKGKTMSDIF